MLKLYIYIYIYIPRERDRERDRETERERVISEEKTNQLTFTCSKSLMETLEKGVNYVESY